MENEKQEDELLAEEDEMKCQECGAELSKKDEYHMRFRTCDQNCYMTMVGMSWSDFM